MNILVLGSGKFFENFLNIYIESNLYEINVYCFTDRKFIETYKRKYQNIKFQSINSYQEDEQEIKKIIKQNRIDLILSIQYKWIISEEILRLMKNKIINFHNAKIPEYRGHHSLTYEILNDEPFHTCTIHWIDKIVDQGTIIMTKKIKIEKNETAYSLLKKSLDAGSLILKDLLFNIKNISKNIEGEKIINKGKFYSKKDIRKIKEIKNNFDFYKLEKISRACYCPPFEPAYLINNGKKIYLLPENYETYDKNK